MTGIAVDAIDETTKTSSPLSGKTLSYSKTEEQVTMQHFGKSETECLRDVVKKFGQQYSTFEKIKDDFPVMMVCTSTNHAQKVWYTALLCSNLKLLRCKGVNAELPVPLNLIANKTSVGYEIDYGYVEQHDYKNDYNQLEALTNKAQGVVMKLPRWSKVLPRVKFFKYLALVHMKHNTADTANLFQLEFKEEKKITLKLKEEHDSLMMTQYANSLHHVLCDFLGESTESKVLRSRLYKSGYQNNDIDNNWLDCSSDALKMMKRGYSKNKKDDPNKNKNGKDGQQKLDINDDEGVGTGSSGKIKGRKSFIRLCNKNKTTDYTEKKEEEEEEETEEEVEKKTEQNSTVAGSSLKRKLDEENEKVGSKKKKNEHTVVCEPEKNKTMPSGTSENLDPLAKKIEKKITSFTTTATFTDATVAKFQTFEKQFEKNDKYPFPIAGDESDVSDVLRNLDCMKEEGKYIEKLRNNWSDSKSFVNLAVEKFDNASDFWNYMQFVQKYVLDQGRFEKSLESWLKSKNMMVAAAAKSKKAAGNRGKLTDNGDISDDSAESLTKFATKTPTKNKPSATLTSVLTSVLASVVSPDDEKKLAAQSKTKLKKSKPVIVSVTEGKTDHLATIVDESILLVLAGTSSSNRSLASLFPEDAKMNIQWQNWPGIHSVFIKDARFLDMNEPSKAAKARSIEREADKRANLLLRKILPEDMKDIRYAIWGEGEGMSTMSIVDGSGREKKVKRSSMDTLKPKEWLSDEIMNDFYLAIAKRTTKKKMQCHCFKSFFMTELLSEKGEYKYDKVKRWSKKVQGGDIFALDKILLPINVKNIHWSCAVIFMQKKQIQIVDSLGDANDQRYLEALMRYLKDDHLDKKEEALPDMENWTLVSTPKNAPRQKNGKLIYNSWHFLLFECRVWSFGRFSHIIIFFNIIAYDCGVFSCIAADFLSDDLPLKFDQHHIKQSRDYIALTILRAEE